MRSRKSLWGSENDILMGCIWGGVGVCRLCSETELTSAPIGSGGLTTPLFWSIRFSSISMASRYFEDHSMELTSYPSRTFWYQDGSRCWTTIRLTMGVEKSCPSDLHHKIGFLIVPRYLVVSWVDPWESPKRRHRLTRSSWISQTWSHISMTFWE